ncbi:hypothetical protein J6590_038518 [Homalodisca vitripennis]|nr:hypothetical protein J6590_038518 [Homalodisca vitripennis]
MHYVVSAVTAVALLLINSRINLRPFTLHTCLIIPYCQHTLDTPEIYVTAPLQQTAMAALTVQLPHYGTHVSSICLESRVGHICCEEAGDWLCGGCGCCGCGNAQATAWLPSVHMVVTVPLPSVHMVVTVPLPSVHMVVTVGDGVIVPRCATERRGLTALPSLKEAPSYLGYKYVVQCANILAPGPLCLPHFLTASLHHNDCLQVNIARSVLGLVT